MLLMGDCYEVELPLCRLKDARLHAFCHRATLWGLRRFRRRTHSGAYQFAAQPSKLDKILDNRGTFTDSEIEQMLGAPASIEMGGENVIAGQMRMSWEDVSRVELTLRESVLVALKSTFSPRLKSQSINYPTFRKFHTGMTVDACINSSFSVMEREW